jgi:hypothetical protein
MLVRFKRSFRALIENFSEELASARIAFALSRLREESHRIA